MRVTFGRGCLRAPNLFTYFPVWIGIVAYDTKRPEVNRRLEDRIRGLCQALINSDNDGEEFHSLSVELRNELSAHIGRLRQRAAAYPIATERRSSETNSIF